MYIYVYVYVIGDRCFGIYIIEHLCFRNNICVICMYIICIYIKYNVYRDVRPCICVYGYNACLYIYIYIYAYILSTWEPYRITLFGISNNIRDSICVYITYIYIYIYDVHKRGVCIFTSGYTYESVRKSMVNYYSCGYYRTRRTYSDGD